MKTNLLSAGVLSLLALATTLTACARSSANDPSHASAASLTSATPSSPAAELAGTWAFVLAASDVAGGIRQECVERSAHDVTRANACWNEFATEAAREKIRFTTDAAGRTVWTSFGSEGPKEVVFLEAPVELEAAGPVRVLVKVAGAPTGAHAAQFEKSGPHVIALDVVDAHTIVMNDPSKGRLVFSRE